MKILLVHSNFGAGGGAEVYAVAIFNHLTAQGHSVARLDITGLNTPEGKQKRPLSFALADFPGLRGKHLLAWALVCRASPKIANQYDRAIFSYGEGPAVCCPSLHLRHAPALFSVNPDLIACLGDPSRARRIYIHACRMLAGKTSTAARNLANSQWTANMAETLAGQKTDQVLYPPVNPTPERSSAQRDPHRIIALGRIAPNKRLEEAVSITAGLRQRGLPAHLEIIGRANTAYGQRFLQAYAKTPFVTLCPDASNAEVSQALARASIGLHCYRQEHFGISVAEMILAGVVPMVFDGGGVAELVPAPNLRFSTEAQAIARIAALMNSPPAGLLERLQNNKALKAACAFEDNLSAALAPFLAEVAG